MKLGTWYVQRFSDRDLYFLALALQKNGGFKGIQVTHETTTRRAPKARQASVPASVAGILWKEIGASDVPSNVWAVVNGSP